MEKTNLVFLGCQERAQLGKILEIRIELIFLDRFLHKRGQPATSLNTPTPAPTNKNDKQTCRPSQACPNSRKNGLERHSAFHQTEHPLRVDNQWKQRLTGVVLTSGAVGFVGWTDSQALLIHIGYVGRTKRFNVQTTAGGVTLWEREKWKRIKFYSWPALQLQIIPDDELG